MGPSLIEQYNANKALLRELSNVGADKSVAIAEELITLFNSNRGAGHTTMAIMGVKAMLDSEPMHVKPIFVVENAQSVHEAEVLPRLNVVTLSAILNHGLRGQKSAIQLDHYVITNLLQSLSSTVRAKEKIIALQTECNNMDAMLFSDTVAELSNNYHDELGIVSTKLADITVERDGLVKLFKHEYKTKFGAWLAEIAKRF
jgi:hypothetical protein